MPILHSQLCTEIMLPSSLQESFVCCVSSMNISKYDEWKGTDADEVLTWLLEAVMTEFIDKAEWIAVLIATAGLLPVMELAKFLVRRTAGAKELIG